MTARILVRIAFGLLLFGGAFFGAAGTLNWPEAWAYLTIHFSLGVSGAFWLKKNDPALLEDRMKYLKGSARGWDKAFMILATIVFIPFLIIPGLDAVRYQWSDIPLVLRIVAFGGVVAAFVLVMWVMRVNSFASRIVEIQKNRGHKVISTGPYRYVRHPMYVGGLLLMYCLPIALGSLWGLVPSTVLLLMFIVRTYLEDNLLHKELEGYVEYAGRVRYRLLPGIW